MFVKVYLTVSNLAYVEKKARGRLTAPACLSTCFKMVSAFFRGEPLGYPWEGGWSEALFIRPSLLQKRRFVCVAHLRSSNAYTSVESVNAIAPFFLLASIVIYTCLSLVHSAPITRLDWKSYTLYSCRSTKYVGLLCLSVRELIPTL